jgi:cellulose synthase/poly-beta-1,6-N-acetylglucosamine synthase-like glycosyltransferase
VSARADLPLVSVVMETVTVGYDEGRPGSLADELEGSLHGLARQSYPSGLIEALVVVGADVPSSVAEHVTRRFPFVRLVVTPISNYLAAKNAGGRTARGRIVAMLDADCVPGAEWLERLVSRFDDPGVAVVAGRTRYADRSLWMRALSVPSFGYILAARSGEASGFNLNNVAFRAGVLRDHPLEERIPRNGGCSLLYHELRAAEKKIVYEPLATTAHGIEDVRGLRVLKKHFTRGYDGVVAYRIDDARALRGTRIFRRFGFGATFVITAWRLVRDWSFIVRHRRQIGIPGAATPYFGAVALATRLIELAGMLRALADPRAGASG